jgi:hypothetical protein
MVDYLLEGPKWGASGLGAAGGVVTWAIDATVSASFLSDITAAFADWSIYGNIQFSRVASTASSMIDFTCGAIDGHDNVLAQTTYYYSGSAMMSATVEMDSGEDWYISNGHGVSYDGLSFFVVALHEIGHAIGLDHYNAAPAVMNAYINPSVTDLRTSDIDGVRALYGTAPATGLASDKLVDQSFYFAKYADAGSSGLSAATHYDNFGWQQGKDPDAYFSTNGYLAAHADVRTAGVNPLLQYDQTGWKLGYDASAAFDTSLYLEHNPDVKAAGMDPLAHYLQYGKAEGRPAYAAVGQASSFTHGSFDAEFYLLSNPDVAKVAIAAGGDSFAFAYAHYEQYGRHEGRNPNSLFDVKGYLNAYADVRNAGMEPLTHYDNYGWKEGRDPSAAFDTKHYEASYADVASAHIDPLQHFLAYGVHEGRASFSDGVIG